MGRLTARLSAALLWLNRHRRWVSIAALVFAFAYPFIIARIYFVTLAEDVLIYAIFAMSLDLLLGYTGLISFGHAAFFGVGAYILAYLTTRFGVTNLLVSVPVVLLGTAAVALLVGFFALRTRGIYFLMVTLAFAQMLFSIAINWTVATGGSDGLAGVPRPSLGVGPFSYTFDSRESFYYLVLVFFLLTFWLLRRVVSSPFGWTLRGIRENEARMRALGYNTFRFKLASFAIGGAFAGLAGLLLAHSARIASPENLYWTTSGQVMIMVIVGGASTLSGPVFGAATVRLLRNFISSATPRWETLMGVIFILFVIFALRGIMGMLSDARKRFEAEYPASAARPAEISESPQVEAE